MWLMDHIKYLISASLAAFLAAVPLVMIHFNLFSLIGPLGSALMYLPATLLTFGGFFQLGCSIFIPPLYPLICGLNDYFGRVLTVMAIELSKLPASAFTVPTPAWGVVAAYFGVLFAPAIKWRKQLLLIIVAVYLSMWMVQSTSSSPWVYVSGPGEGTTVAVNTGDGLALIDCGGSQTGQAANLVKVLSCNLLAQLELVILTVPEERYFNDAWAIAGIFPELKFAASSAFKPRAFDYEPASQFVGDKALQKIFWTPGSVFSLGEVHFEMLYPPDLPQNLSAAGAVSVACQGRHILIGTDLTDLACQLICANNPHFQADTLVLKGNIPGGGVEMLIGRAGVREIVLQGIFHQRERRQLKTIVEKHHIRLFGVETSNGFLINLP
jgi:beta-lactamase superfamily II metal-dependent hydrolase